MMLLDTIFKRVPMEGSSRQVAGPVGSSMASMVPPMPSAQTRNITPSAATRVVGAVPLVLEPPRQLPESVERGFAARWKMGVHKPSFLYNRTGLLNCDDPWGDMWDSRRRRARPRRAAPVVLPLLRRVPEREEDRPIEILSSHVIMRTLETRRRSSTKRPTMSSSLTRARNLVRHGAYRFPTHSMYQGDWQSGLKVFEGSGNYLGPHKVEYEGEFQDGMCHGPGELLYPNGAVVSGVWDRGHLNQPQYISHDGLNFHPDGPYCKMPDRRFYTEIQKGLRPAGRSQLTNQHPARPVPHGCYDAGDGIFDPRRNAICEPETLEVVRVPTTDEMDWIKQNCRKGWDENVGYRPDLYENWIYEPSVMSEESEVSREEEAMVEEEKGEEEEEEEEEKEDKGEEELSEKEKEEKKSLETLLSMETPVVVEYPPVAVQDVTIDIGPLTDVTDMLVPEMEITGESVKDKLMIPADKELVPENQRILARYLKMIEQSEEVKEEDKEIPGKEEPGESPPPTPRLDLDETDDVYKGAWRHVARRLLPLLRQRLEDDRHAAAAKWQEDLVQLLSERASTQGLEMSTSGFLGATASVSEPEGPMRKRGSSRIFPPGLEERARARRAEREEREREENAKRQAEVLAKERAKMEGRRMAEHGSSSSEGTEATEAGGSPRGSAKPSSVLPASTSMAVPKGGRESASSREGTEQMSRKKRSLMFKDNEEEID